METKEDRPGFALCLHLFLHSIDFHIPAFGGQSVVYFGDCERERALANVAVTVKNGDNRLRCPMSLLWLPPSIFMRRPCFPSQ